MSKREDDRLTLREAVNVDDLKERDRLVRRFRKIRANAVLDKNTLIHWNRTHPNEKPLDETMFDDIIAYCDGTGPMPEYKDPRYVPRGKSDSERPT